MFGSRAAFILCSCRFIKTTTPYISDLHWLNYLREHAKRWQTSTAWSELSEWRNSRKCWDGPDSKGRGWQKNCFHELSSLCTFAGILWSILCLQFPGDLQSRLWNQDHWLSMAKKQLLWGKLCCNCIFCQQFNVFPFGTSMGVSRAKIITQAIIDQVITSFRLF